MFGADNFTTVSGVTLMRDISGERNLRVILFLKDIGVISLSSKNFGGDSEPFLWAKYWLRKNRLARTYFVYDIEVVDTMIKIRQKKERMIMLLHWARSILKYLPYGHPDNDLLANFYWNMKLLCAPGVPCDAADWRFIWKWLENWGLAPDVVNLYANKNFNKDELSLLVQILLLNTKRVAELFTKPLSGNIRENVFKVASKIALTFLNEK